MPNISKDMVAGPFDYTEQNSRLKNLTEYVWKMNELQSRAACPPVLCCS